MNFLPTKQKLDTTALTDLLVWKGTYQRRINPALITRSAATPLWVQESTRRGRSSHPTPTACLASSLDRMAQFSVIRQ